MKNKKIVLGTVITVFTGIFTFFTFSNQTEIEKVTLTTNLNAKVNQAVNKAMDEVIDKAKEPDLTQQATAQTIAKSTNTVAEKVNEVKNQQKPVIDPDLKRQLLSSQKVFVQ